jgi:hypothetical protein
MCTHFLKDVKNRTLVVCGQRERARQRMNPGLKNVKKRVKYEILWNYPNFNGLLLLLHLKENTSCTLLAISEELVKVRLETNHWRTCIFVESSNSWELAQLAVALRGCRSQILAQKWISPMRLFCKQGTVTVKLSLYWPWRPLGLREVEVPTFLDILLTDGGKVVSPMRRAVFTPRKIPGTHFC